nr:MAG TPA: hypothetical protein [Caudoviricetes sp.]
MTGFIVVLKRVLYQFSYPIREERSEIWQFHI